MRAITPTSTMLLLGVLLAGCGGTAVRPAPDPAGSATAAPDDPTGGDRTDDAAAPDQPDDEADGPGSADASASASGGRAVLSPCSADASRTRTTVVEPDDDARPSMAAMEAALDASPDLQELVAMRMDDGASREDAVHDAYAQVVAEGFFRDASALPGYLSGAVARPLEGATFELVLREPLPATFDLAAHELASYGLVVTTPGTGIDQAAFDDAYDVAVELGMRVLWGSLDEIAGTGTIEVIDATAEQVAEWEARTVAAEQVCLVRAESTTRCDDEVVDDAVARATASDPVAVGAGPDRDAEVVAGHVGRTVEDSMARAETEGRPWRAVVEDGVELALTMDLSPGRLNATVCRGVVVDASVER